MPLIVQSCLFKANDTISYLMPQMHHNKGDTTMENTTTVAKSNVKESMVANVTMPVYRVKNFCTCGLCRGNVLANTVQKKAVFNLLRVGILESYLTGGRNPELIIFPKDCFKMVYESATGNLGNGYNDFNNFFDTGIEFEDSPHSCNKVRKHQKIHLYQLCEMYHVKPELIEL